MWDKGWDKIFSTVEWGKYPARWRSADPWFWGHARERLEQPGD